MVIFPISIFSQIQNSPHYPGGGQEALRARLGAARSIERKINSAETRLRASPLRRTLFSDAGVTPDRGVGNAENIGIHNARSSLSERSRATPACPSSTFWGRGATSPDLIYDQPL